MWYGPFVLAAALGTGLDWQQPLHQTRQTFVQRVDEYVALHRRLEGPLPRAVVTAEPYAMFVSRHALALAIREARADARQGDIFSPPIAQYFRIAIAEALREGDVHDMLAIVEEENSVNRAARVNAEYPAGASIPLMPTCLLAALPQLPPELQYRFLGRDLILWDVHAGLIVDFLSDAIPETTSGWRQSTGEMEIERRR